MVSAVSQVIVFGVQRIGRYEVLNHLASGGMGQVYLARATGLGGFERQVVVKTLDLSVTEDDEAFVTMFLDEARLVGALHHQYIAPVYEVGCDEEGRYFLVMDYVQGETAEAVFRVASERMQPVPLPFALTIGSCVASALEYAHGLCSADGAPLDIVHRDVSLSNVMCGHDGSVKLIDFGIAKAANRATKTQVGTLKGKIGYLAPEQILRGPVDHRADIFALGIVLYELTTGTRAFRETSDLVTLERITTGELRKPSEVVAGYPAELERILLKALQTDPELRYQTAGALGRALEAYAAATAIPLGHAAIIDAMQLLFGDRRGRRRIARGSSPEPTTSSTDASIMFDPGEDEKTPVTDLVESATGTLTIESETLTRNVALARSQRPTTPIVEKRKASRPPIQRVAPEDAPTPIADPALARRVRNALIPLEDRPTPIAETPLPLPPLPSIASPGSAGALRTRAGSAELIASPGSAGALSTPAGSAELIERPTPPQRPSAPPRRIVTGPQPQIQIEDMPTQIASGSLPQRADLAGQTIERLPPIPTPVTGPRRPRNTGTAVIALPEKKPDHAMRTWLLLCGLFVVAMTVAVIVAML